MHDKNDSLIEKLAAANKLKANPVAKIEAASNHAAATPPSFLTKESAQSLFGFTRPQIIEPTIIINPAEEPDNYAASLMGDLDLEPTGDSQKSSVQEPMAEATVIAKSSPVAAIAPAPTHEELLKEIQKLELLGDKKAEHEPVIALATVSEAAQVEVAKAKAVRPSWRSWLMPIAVAFAGIACISILPKAPDVPEVVGRPAVTQKSGVVSAAPSAPVVAKTEVVAEPVVTPVSVAPAAAVVAAVAASATVAAAPAAATTIPAADSSQFVVRKTEIKTAKVAVTKKPVEPLQAKHKAEAAVASARAVAPKSAQSKTAKTVVADHHTGQNTGHLDLPKVPVVAAAPIVAAVAPVIVPKAAVAKGPDQCVGMTGMAAEQCRQCSGYFFVRRLSCEGQIRVKYCEGREGMVSDCPTSYDTRR